MKKKYVALIMILFLVLSLSQLPVVAYETNTEVEGNNTVGTANRTYNDYNNYGAISSVSDVDWWKVSFTQTGTGNFWLGNIPTGCKYWLYVYESDGVSLIAKI